MPQNITSIDGEHDQEKELNKCVQTKADRRSESFLRHVLGYSSGAVTPLGSGGGGEDEDARSVESFSTTATVDNNPGTGRALDMYFFQPLGRRIERLAMRFTIRHLHPLRIEAFIHGNLVYFPWLAPERTLGLALQDINTFRSGPTIIAGLKDLIQQTQ